MIPDDEITVEKTENYIKKFNKEYGVYDDALIQLFDNADNSDYINVFCRVGLIDLIYSTGIQRFNKGGIDTITKYINRYFKKVDKVKGAETIDLDVYRLLLEVDYSTTSSDRGKENNIPVFASKFLNFTNPDVYPIMDSIVKKVIGVQKDTVYQEYCEQLDEFIEEKIKPVVNPVIAERGKKYSLKDIDKFLWMWGKENWSTLSRK